MPSRVIREGLITSEAVASLTAWAEVLFVHLMLIADDYGRHDARIPLLRAKLFPFKLDKVTDGDVSAWLEECRAAELVVLYEVNGKPYLEIPRFGQRMRAKVSKFPPPPGELPSDDGHTPATYQTDDGHVSGTRRPESESESESEVSPSEIRPLPASPAQGVSEPKPVKKTKPKTDNEADPRFVQFWQAYPLKVGKPDAAKAFAKVDPSPELLTVMLAAIEAQKGSRKWVDGYIRNPSTWLNNRGWEDQLPPANGATINPAQSRPAAKTMTVAEAERLMTCEPEGGAR